jgi:hypothetical protein
MEHVSFLVFPITCNFFIPTKIIYNKKYLNQMCNSKKNSFIIDATRTYNFKKIHPFWLSKIKLFTLFKKNPFLP